MNHVADTLRTSAIDTAAPNLDARLRRALVELAATPKNDPRRQALRHDIIEHAMPLADRLARRFANRGVPLEDLTQVARLGLVKAVDGFTTRRGSEFSRFAVPTILGELKRHFRDKGWIIRVPRRLQETRLALNEATPILNQELGRTPTVDDYATYLRMSPEDVRAGMACVHAYDAVSLHTPAHPGSEEELSELIGEEDPAMSTAETRTTLRPIIDRLPERERRILAMRYADDLTQAQIADRIHLSQMHVSRLLRQSLARLREELRAGRREPVRG
ncbi:RNA polymerase sigma-28 (SigD/FliA/WhiG) subunit [Stackebrandtia endophytica]|uniref:RNA polymerase sigma-28 (SigD/FliA/WhiG) subunit n=1 Tax=Stackebrandtia endophytica TaxID=1496996 RepID=A0A543AUP1_9ACTN|nr:SigB/SigF/SigG family RNA polymerase sigma factor [Stackebrandtia endophytica]TQL76294.1 RNA polymerase sigma-28 (SigD/FliA/WhiG) subunit [Stackebrandtia endophytica]